MKAYIKIILILLLFTLFTRFTYAQKVTTHSQKTTIKELQHQVFELITQRHYDEAIRLAEKGLKLAEEIYGLNHWNTMFFVLNLREIYRRQDRKYEFEKLNNRVKAYRQEWADRVTQMYSDEETFLQAVQEEYLRELRKDEGLRDLSDEELLNLDEEFLRELSAKNVLRMTVTQNESIAKSWVKAIFTAIETYAAEHNGKYPSDENDLLNADPPYLSKSFDNKTIQGYNYSLKLSPNDYEIIASPSQCETTGTKIFRLKRYKDISEVECK